MLNCGLNLYGTIWWNFLINKGKLFLEKDFVSWN